MNKKRQKRAVTRVTLQPWEKAQAKADGIYEDIEKMLVKEGVPVQSVKAIMQMVNDYREAEFKVEAYCENPLEDYKKEIEGE